MEVGGTHGFLPFAYELLGIERPWETGNTIFIILTAGSIRLQLLVANQLSHRWPWLISVGHKAKVGCLNMERDF